MIEKFLREYLDAYSQFNYNLTFSLFFGGWTVDQVRCGSQLLYILNRGQLWIDFERSEELPWANYTIEYCPQRSKMLFSHNYTEWDSYPIANPNLRDIILIWLNVIFPVNNH